MTRAKAKAAVDDAFADGIKRLFGTLVTVLETNPDTINHEDAVKRFRNGVAFHAEAHSRATAAVETIFPT